jgi:hypothetical protein
MDKSSQVPWTQWWLIALLVVASPIIIAFVLIGLVIHLVIRLGLHLAVWAGGCLAGGTR